MNPIQFYVSDGYRITSPFGWRNHPITGVRSFHHGTDLGGKPRGYPLRTPFGGIVIGRGFGRIYGNWVTIRSLRAKVVYFFAHLTEYTVAVGQTLTPEAVIGSLGATGSATGVHLHFEVRLDDGSNNGNGVWGDPEKYFEEIGGTGMIQHIVIKGDTLGRIAAQYDITLAELLAANPDVQDPNRISVGQVIRIPEKIPKEALVKTPVYMDGKVYEAYLIDNRTYVSIRNFAKDLGCEVEFQGSSEKGTVIRRVRADKSKVKVLLQQAIAELEKESD